MSDPRPSRSFPDTGPTPTLRKKRGVFYIHAGVITAGLLPVGMLAAYLIGGAP